MKERSSEHRETLKRKDADVKEATAYLRTESVEAKRLLKEANNVVKASRDQPDLTELLHSLGDYNSERLEGDIDSEKAHLELTQGGNSNVIKEFDERERQIQKLRGKLSDFETQLTEYNYAINEVRGKWEPKLEALVKRISDAFGDSFARIGCAGQVTLDKAEDLEQQSSGDSDFDQWSIQIYVKFRESENLSQLNSHRQSGGERAVSTIFYLMALQSLSASPFRVVDEINQGMDPRNERMVHERLVDIACAGSTVNNESVGGSGGGQYFLVTPKLLSGLVYKPGMRVLCIVSGEHMPEDYTRLDFTHAVQRLRAVAEKSGRSKGKRRAIENGSGGVRGVRISA